MKTTNTVEIIKIFILGVFICVGVGFVFAGWAPPLNPSTENNIPGPINVGPINQSKGGVALKYSLLDISGNLASDSLAIFSDVVLSRDIIFEAFSSKTLGEGMVDPTKERRLCVDKDGKLTVTCDALPVSYTISVTKDGSGTGLVEGSLGAPVGSGTNPGGGIPGGENFNLNCGSTCSSSAPVDTIVTLNAIPDSATGEGPGQEESIFAGWGGACSGIMPNCSVTMSQSRNVTATFLKNVPELTINRYFIPSNVSAEDKALGVVASSPSGINCGTRCNETFIKDSEVTISAPPMLGDPDIPVGSLPEEGTHVGLNHWDGDLPWSCKGYYTENCTFTMSGKRVVSAYFQVWKSIFVWVKKSNGQYWQYGKVIGTADVVGFNDWFKLGAGNYPEVSAASGGMWVPANTVVTLTAIPSDGHVFAGWSGGGCSGTNPVCTITLDQGRTVTAMFD